MAILKARCPECNAGLKSATGFKVGQTVSCPKCETYFAVEEPAGADDEAPKKASAAPAGKKTLKAAVADDDDADDDAPKKKKKKKASYDEDEEGTRSYKNSPLRYAVLGVLVVVMLVLGYFLYEKKKKEREDDAAPTAAGDGGDLAPVANPKVVNPKGGNGPKLNPLAPPGFGPVGNPNPNLNPKKGNPGGVVGGGGGPAVPFGLGGSPAQTPAQMAAQMEKFKARLVGTWVAVLDKDKDVTEELTYTADGTFTSKLTGPAPAMLTAKYMIKELAGSKGVRIQLDTPGGTRTVVALFDGEELEHPSLQAGVTGTFLKK